MPAGGLHILLGRCDRCNSANRSREVAVS